MSTNQSQIRVASGAYIIFLSSESQTQRVKRQKYVVLHAKTFILTRVAGQRTIGAAWFGIFFKHFPIGRPPLP